MLEIEGLTVEVSGKVVLREIDLRIADNEVMVLFGPNGSGKSSLIRTIMGFEGYNVKEGSIKYNGRVLNDLPVDERVRQGLGMMFQNPPEIRGVGLHQISDFLCGDSGKKEALTDRLDMRSHMHRGINVDFSGGERKRSEVLQLVLQDPMFALIDEPESGVDLENISVISRVIDDFLKQKGRSALVITHTGYILDYIDAKKGCLMINGQLWCRGRDPREMFQSIRKEGYMYCKRCHGEKEHG